jgi:3-oxoacyl-[acyl-carrier-protein] synthase II
MTAVPVVVTGVGIICALGRNRAEFWSNLIAGLGGVLPVHEGPLAALPGAHAGQVPAAWLPEVPDRNTALALTALQEAWEHAGLGPDSASRDRTGLVLGKCQASPAGPDGSCEPFHATSDRLATRFGLAGPRVVISTACAAGANAVGTGMDLLRGGAADVVAVGGVDVLLGETFTGFGRLKALSPAAAAPYSRSDGLSLGEGAAFLILEPEPRALGRGARPLARVAGYGLAADAFHATSPDPSGRGALLAVRRALNQAGLEFSDVSYVNGHGTGTPANDQMERRVLRALCGDAAVPTPMSSTKAAIGHTLGAAGAIESAVCVLAIVEGMLPPTVNVGPTTPERLDIVPGVGRPARVDVAMSNSYAFGGNNCSVIFAGPRPALPRQRQAEPVVAPVPARRVMITGLGATGGCGLGLARWRSALLEGRSLVRRLPEFSGLGCDVYGVLAGPLGGRPPAPPSLWRHMDPHARQALCAVASALEDAGWPARRAGRDEIGLVFATGYGPVNTATRAAAAGGPDPVDFANSVMNAAPGAICQAMNMRGPTTTVASGGVSALIALDIAVSLIRAGQADRVVVAAADELSELALREYANRNRLAADGVIRPYATPVSGTALGSAAVALLLEADEVRDPAGKAYAEVAAISHLGRADPDDAATVLRSVLRRVVAQAGCPAEEVGYCAGFASGSAEDLDELAALADVFPAHLLLSTPKSVTGECAAASGGVALLAAALALADQRTGPAAVMGDVIAAAGNPAAAGNQATGVPVAAAGSVAAVRLAPGTPLRWALANAASPDSAYGSALLAAAR